LLAAASDQWSRHRVVEIAEHPLLASGLDANVLNLVGYAQQMTGLDDWRESLHQLVERCLARERGDDEDDEYRKALPPAAAVRTTLDAWDALAPRLHALDAARPLADWFAWTAATLGG
jgi:hypothetical protein